MDMQLAVVRPFQQYISHTVTDGRVVTNGGVERTPVYYITCKKNPPPAEFSIVPIDNKDYAFPIVY